jgi:hypothetical protein
MNTMNPRATKGHTVPAQPELPPPPPAAEPAQPALSRPVALDRSKATVGHMITLRKLAIAVDAKDGPGVDDLMLDLVELVDALVVDAALFPASEFWPLVGEVNRQFSGGAVKN